MNKICFLYQNAFSQTGGIQTFNKYFISALEDIVSDNENISAEIVGIYDKGTDVRTTLPFQTLDSSKVNAFKYILKNAKQFDTFIFAHVNLAPLAVALHILNSNARIIFCTHGIEIWKKLPKLTEWIMDRSTVLTVSNFSMKELKKYNPNLEDVRLFPNCIKVKTDDIVLENPFDAKQFNILSVTRLSSSEKLKGIDTVINALPSLVEKIPNIKYSVIGKGDDVKRLQQLANELKVSEYVDFLGFVDDIHAYYQHCDVFTLPSKKEGFGIVYLEAMQYKKPVVAVNYGGPTDVIRNEETGYLCSYDDEQCIAAKILLLSTNSIKSRALGENGFEYLMGNFTYPEFKHRLSELLNDGSEKC